MKKELLGYLIAAVVGVIAGVIGGMVISDTKTPECECKCSCPPDKAKPVTVSQPKPKKIIKAKRTPEAKPSGLKWKGLNLPTDMNGAQYLGQKLFKRYWDECLAKFRQGPFDGLLSCIEWSKIEGVWLTGFKKTDDPRIQFWARVAGQHALNRVGNVVCTNHNPYFQNNLPPKKLYGKKRKVFLKWRELLKKRAKKNEARLLIFIRGLGDEAKHVPEIQFPQHPSC